MSDLDVMKEWLQEEYTIGIPKNVYTIVSKFVPKKYNKKSWILKICLIIHRLSEMSWYTQKQISEDIGINKKELIKLNKVQLI